MTLRPTSTFLPARWTAVAALAAAAAIPAMVQGAERAHQHGQAALEVSIDGSRVSVTMHAPLESLVGFERPARGAAEHRTVERMQRQLKEGAALVRTTLAAGCVLMGDQVDAPVLKVGAKADGEHADLVASWDFECLQPDKLGWLEFGLFDRFGRLGRLEVQLTTAQGPRQVTLNRPSRRIELTH